MSKFEQSRRDFLRIAGKGVMGAAAISAIPSVMQPALAEDVEAPAWPWEWKKLDKQKVQERAYAAFSTHGGCCAGIVGGILDELAEEYGYPYNQLNPRMFANGAGGYGRKILCGALGGGCAVLGLFCEGSDAGALRNELYTWYENHEFPQYQPVVESPLTVSNSILCADSVGSWMAVTGKEFSDPDRLARCAGLTAEVAVKVVELLNIKYGFEEAPVVEEAAAEAPALAVNERIGVGKGFEGEVKVKVTKDGDKITKIDVLEQKESMPQSSMTDIPAAVIAAQSADVDVIAGSTYSSNAVIEAIKDALSQF